MKKKPTMPKISEKVFTKQVIDLARWHKWLVAHFRTSMNASGRWMTAVQGDGAGFPDLVLARNGEVIFAELKTEIGKLSPKQVDWYKALPQRSYYLWRPSDYPEIERTLK